MNVFGLRLSIDRPAIQLVGVEGVVRFVGLGGDHLTIQWHEIPLASSAAVGGWRSVVACGRPLEYSAGDRWIAPSFVNGLYLRTNPTSDQFMFVVPERRA